MGPRHGPGGAGEAGPIVSRFNDVIIMISCNKTKNSPSRGSRLALSNVKHQQPPRAAPATSLPTGTLLVRSLPRKKAVATVRVSGIHLREECMAGRGEVRVCAGRGGGGVTMALVGLKLQSSTEMLFTSPYK